MYDTYIAKPKYKKKKKKKLNQRGKARSCDI